MDSRDSHKKSWKAFQANYDEVFALSDRYCMYCLTEQQVNAILVMATYLKWPTRWVSDTGSIQVDKIDAFASDLEWRLMNGCCDDNLPIQYRYSPEGVLERSLNAGGTWTAAPEYDPRVYSPQFPPIAGDDGSEKKCIAATGAAALIKEQIGDQLTDDMSRYTLKQLIEDWVGTMLESSNPFQALVTVITNQIFALVITALRAALTDPVYETLACIFYCAIGDDATVDDAQWAQIRTDITDQIGGIAGIFLEHLIYLLGTTGTTNLLRAGGAADGDCSDCDCGEGCSNEWVLRDGFEAFDTIISQDATQITVQAHTPLSNGVYYVDIHTAEYTLGCYINSYNVVSGSVGSIAYTAVPSSAEPAPGLGPVNTCCNRLQPQDAGPFTIQFIFDECPP